MAPRVRFAPSPTGRIHIGNIRTATLNWLFAKQAGGSFMLRLDDTDLERSTEEFAEAIRVDLKWLGLLWDCEERQSLRTDRYDAAAEQLKKSGHLYACYETQDELDRRRKRQLAMQRPPIYNRAALKLSADDVAAFEAEGRKPHWRFRLPNTTGVSDLEPRQTFAEWQDLIRGPQHVDLGSLSDPVLVRADGSYLYTFTSVVDDIEFDVTHIVRGEDHVTNTGVQIAIFKALGATPPTFGHHSLLIGADGHALSKRLGALSVQSFRDSGLEPMAVLCHAALVGTSDAIEPYVTREELAALLDFDKISMAPGRFDIEELKGLNAKLLLKLDYAAVEDRLKALGVGGGEPFWLAVRGNLSVLNDARAWWDIVSAPIEPAIENAEFTAKASDYLPPEPFDLDSWTTWTNAVKSATGVKGKALFHPLRLALTGRESGPDMKSLLSLMDRDRVVARLKGQTA